MRLLVSWVRDFVDVKVSPNDIAETLALRGFEVASIEQTTGTAGEDEAVIDFEVTANRPDCLSVLGLAREIATAYDLPLRLPSTDSNAVVRLAEAAIGAAEPVMVRIEDSELCPRYAAAVAALTPGVSPDWLTARLQAAGVRPISPVVDVTNYVLMELGHPLHAFDLSKLAGAELRIRRAAAGEAITTLDGVDRKLEPDMLVIADAARPQAIAGVMGGAASEVSASTRTIVFESAYFKPASVRRTSKRLGIKTEASSRFERGCDINAPVTALQRAIALLQQIGAGRPMGPIADAYPEPRGPRRLHLRRARLKLLLGLEVPDPAVERILRSLGLDVTASQAPADGGDAGWDIVAPTFRVDLTREVDLIEEVGRHYGFDKLESTFPPLTAVAPAPDPRVVRDQLVRRVMTAAGASEAVTFGFIEAKAARAFVSEAEAGGLISIANPLSAKFSAMRPSLIPGLVDAVAHNRRHGRRDVALFEIGARFHAATGETRAVALAWTGAAAAGHWSGPSRDVDFFDVKGVVERLSDVLGVPVNFTSAIRPYLVAGQTAELSAGGAPVGVAGLVAPALAEERGAPRQDRIFVAELNLDRLSSLSAGLADASEQVRPLPRYPSVVRDLSIIVADALPAAIIRGTIQAAGAKGQAPLVETGFFDRYKGKGGEGLDQERVSLSVHLTFQAPDRTLTDVEVQHSVDAILAALVREHGAVQR